MMKDMPSEITCTDEPICVDVDTPQKISTQVKSEHVHDPDEIPEIKRGKYFPICLFDNMEPEEVEYIPGDIDGMKLYITWSNKSKLDKINKWSVLLHNDQFF